MSTPKKDYSAKYRKEYTEKGLCHKCGKSSNGNFYCDNCRKTLTDEARTYRQICRENHICTRCMKQSVMGNDKICFECRAKMNNRRSMQKEKLSERRRELYAMNKEKRELEKQRREQNGICIRCGCRQAAPLRKRCFKCLEYDRIKHLEYKDKKKIGEYNMNSEVISKAK